MEGVVTDASASQLLQPEEEEIHSADATHADSRLLPEGHERQREETIHPSAIRHQPPVVSDETGGLQSVPRASLQAQAADTDQSSAMSVTQPQLFMPEVSGTSTFTVPVMSFAVPLTVGAASEQSCMVTVTVAQQQPLSAATSSAQAFTTLQPVVSVHPLLAAQPGISIMSMENGIVAVRSSDTGSVEDRVVTIPPTDEGSGTDSRVTMQLMDVGSEAGRIVTPRASDTESVEDRTATIQPADKGSGTGDRVTTQLMDVESEAGRIITAQPVGAGSGEKETVNVSGRSAKPAAGIADSQSHLDGCSFLAESELVEIDSVDVDSLVRSEIAEAAGDAGPGSESMDDVEESDQASSASGSSSRWHRAETLKLIDLYKEYQGFFEDKHYKKKTVWAMLADRLAKGSRSRVKYTSAQVCNRWKNLTKMYRDCVENRKCTGPWVGKCQYFDELDSVYNLAGADSSAGPQLQTSGNLRSLQKIRRLQRLAKRAGEKPSSSAGSFVAIAPKRPLPQVGVAPSAVSDVSSIVILAEKNGSPAPCSASGGDEKGFASVVMAVQALHEDQKRVDSWKLDRLERMHKEKMQMFARFLDILKEQKQ